MFQSLPEHFILSAVVRRTSAFEEFHILWRIPDCMPETVKADLVEYARDEINYRRNFSYKMTKPGNLSAKLYKV